MSRREGDLMKKSASGRILSIKEKFDNAAVQIITPKACISSRRSLVYHQHEVLYIIKPQRYTLRVMIYAFGDDIHADA